MFLFKPKKCSDEQIAAFWEWFSARESKLSEKDGLKRAQVLREAQGHIRELFPACPNAVGISVIPDGDRWILNFSYGTKSVAKRTAKRIRVLMPVSLQGKWHMEVDE